MFRGINYKCAMLHYNNAEWAKAIKELQQIANESDPHIYEMLAKCNQRLGLLSNYEDFLQLAITSYDKLGEPEKAEKLRQTLKAL